MVQNFGWPQEQAAEDALHAERLLFIEEKPFQRVTRRLLDKDSTLRNVPRQLPTPPPDAESNEDTPAEKTTPPFSREKFWEDVLIDFAALQSSIIRIQLIHSSNERERERYASEKTKILATAQAVRDNTVTLRAQLAEAQNILALRKGYDELAGKILDDKNLKTRDDGRQDIATLEKEIEELEADGSQIEKLWTERRQGFEAVVEGGHAFLRTIKGVKDQSEEEPKADEEMENGGDDSRLPSNVGTPRPDGTSTPVADGGMTPLQTVDESQVNDEDEQQTQSKLHVTEPATEAPVSDTQDGSTRDVVMNEGLEVSAAHNSPQPAVDENIVEEEDVNVVEAMDES